MYGNLKSEGRDEINRRNVIWVEFERRRNTNLEIIVVKRKGSKALHWKHKIIWWEKEQWILRECLEWIRGNNEERAWERDRTNKEWGIFSK